MGYKLSRKRPDLSQFCKSTLEETRDAYSIGIEEEYFLVDRETFEISTPVSDRFFEVANASMESRVLREFHANQVEIATAPFTSVSALKAELTYARQTLSDIAAEQGLAIVASGTHPTASWHQSVQSDKERYHQIMRDLQIVGWRNMLCGMHVHVELPDIALRCDLMRRMLPYVPLLLALSTSSPFWQSRPTGLKGYRLAAYDELPRTGTAELFNHQDFERYIEIMTRAGAIEDSSYVWWMMRPSLAHPTLELRAPDCCTRIEDAIAIASLYRVLARYLFRNREHNDHVDAVWRAVAIENKWRAQRFGVHATFVTRDGETPLKDILDEVLVLTQDDAAHFECASEVAHCQAIIRNGTSADRQLEVYAASHGRAGMQTGAAAVAEWLTAASRP